MKGRGSCELKEWVKVRIRQVLCTHLAVRGRCSQICRPGSEVAIGLNSPRISAGACGFMSNMSMWLGPPSRLNMMTERALPRGGVSPPVARNRRGKVQPPNSAKAPTRSSSRRVTPSHVLAPGPRIFSMAESPLSQRNDHGSVSIPTMVHQRTDIWKQLQPKKGQEK